uniref:OCEL domain-containing protein n=1 Tax=Percolomonas cosmopolitus TaxID=63605 RepID=A0A7S1KQS6_9EUKA|mmetsp:Transcript_557/g.2009  ORF Transcript_557/g.2009 Transcript_557/m.2009 type:complete len:343 (+) Transcript_557:195-1223(+)
MSGGYNISLNQPHQQSAYPFFSVRLNRELFNQIQENKDSLELKTSTRNNQFQLKIGNKTYSSTGYSEKCVDVLKYSRKAESYIHVGPIHTKLSIEPEMTKSQASRIREETKVSNVRETKSKLLDDASIPNGNGKKRKREKSPALLNNKRIKKTETSRSTSSRGNSRSPNRSKTSSSTSGSASTSTISKPKNAMSMQIPKKSKRTDGRSDAAFEAELQRIPMHKLLEDHNLRGVNMGLKQSPSRHITKINSRKEFQTLWNEYQTLYKDYTKMYKVVRDNDSLFNRLFKMHARTTSKSLKEKVEKQIHQLHDLRQLDQKKLGKKYNMVHEDLQHLQKLLESFRP